MAVVRAAAAGVGVVAWVERAVAARAAVLTAVAMEAVARAVAARAEAATEGGWAVGKVAEVARKSRHSSRCNLRAPKQPCQGVGGGGVAQGAGTSSQACAARGGRERTAVETAR